jgi:hypothetical protein
MVPFVINDRIYVAVKLRILYWYKKPIIKDYVTSYKLETEADSTVHIFT